MTGVSEAPAREPLRHTQPRVQFAPAEPESPHSGHDDGGDTDPVRDAAPPPAAHFATRHGPQTRWVDALPPPRVSLRRDRAAGYAGPHAFRCRWNSCAASSSRQRRAHQSGPPKPAPAHVAVQRDGGGENDEHRQRWSEEGARSRRYTRPRRGAEHLQHLRPARPVLGFANGSCGPDIIHAMELKMRFSSLLIPRVPRDAMYVNEEAAALAHRSGLSGTQPESLCY
ncbi:hypothetical protein HYPSUDRAFT_202285 [Hypholoma sublateritium FD-334 SS-4]|uniref:Uncharacterized protein n=1 Tax=Hypholoma sublateritium (strain FD-334 SS-4) TaxID=945553 RepID=A0A0D2MFB7_HYPSF|nr:hypothetical protein HYPSUDRAFT_202285 [Hypholoma sublateritium FD-334 SS-4]